MTKPYYQAAQKAEKSQHTTTDGPLHRFYQHTATKKHFSAAARHQRLATMQAAEDQRGRVQPLMQKQQYDIYHRQLNQTSDLLQQERQDLTYSIPSNGSDRMRSQLRIVWLQQMMQQLPKAFALRTRFVDAGMEVNIQQLDLANDISLDGELILMECFGTLEQEMMKSVIKIRLFTHAPLIVLTDNHTLDWSIRALYSGADAIFTVNMPDDVIVARSKALLRRWAAL